MVDEGHQGGGGDGDDRPCLLGLDAVQVVGEAGRVVGERHEGSGGDDRY